MSTKKPYQPQRQPTPVVEAPVVAEQPVEEVAPAAPQPDPRTVNLGGPLASLLKAAVNDMHNYGIISDSEAVSLKERLEART